VEVAFGAQTEDQDGNFALAFLAEGEYEIITN
jgi:hypothetical protein